MKPGKTIFLFCSDEERRAVLSFMLRTKGYAIVGAIPPVADMALLVDSGSESEVLASAISKVQPELPMLIVAGAFRDYVPYGNYPCTARMLDPEAEVGELLRRVRMILARKKGPRKQEVFA
jgi:hypothetical protein